MKNILFIQKMVHDYPSDFEFDAFSYKIREAFKNRKIILNSSFSFGSGNDGLPASLPRIQLNDDLGYYSVTMSLQSVDFKVDCTSFEFTYEDFKTLANEIINVLLDLKITPSKRSVATSVVIEMDDPVSFLRKNLLSQENSFFDNDLALNFSINVTDGFRIEDGWGLIRVTNISDAFRNSDGGETERFVHVYREINNLPSDSPVPRISYDRFMEIGADELSFRAIKEVLKMEV